jgi:hypothetical protein
VDVVVDVDGLSDCEREVYTRAHATNPVPPVRSTPTVSCPTMRMDHVCVHDHVDVHVEVPDLGVEPLWTAWSDCLTRSEMPPCPAW